MRTLWRIWPHLAYRLYRNDERKREDFLSTFAPFHLILLLVVWVTMLVIGWGLFFYGVRDELHPSGIGFASSVYYAGASLLTLGYGDIVATSTFARVMSLVAASSGLGVVAVVTSFLFAIFGAFQNRETFVVTIGARAGVPPSGLGLLAVHAFAELRDDLPQVFRDGQTWTAHVMESHLAYPVLMMFRSSHDYESWLGTLGTLLDAAVLVMSTLDPADMVNSQTQGQARIMYDIGRHLASDFSSYLKFKHVRNGSVGVERREFELACAHLEKAGYKLRDADAAWKEFSRLRAAYSSHLGALARWLEIPPVQWVGGRPSLTHGGNGAGYSTSSIPS